MSELKPNWQKLKIEDFLFERSGRYKPDNEIVKNLKRLEKIDFSGNIHFSNKPSGTDMILVQNGDFVISGINVAKGAMTIYRGEENITATIHYSSYIFDPKKINIEYFEWFLKSEEFINSLKKQVKGGIKTEIKPKHLLALEILLPDLRTQSKIISNLHSRFSKTNKVKDNSKDQNQTIQSLRQQILQDAISGKLSEKWRKDNPNVESAEALLEKIKIEKEKLINEGKIKKQKVLPEVSDDEIQFELPGNWMICRFGDYALLERGKFSIRPRNDPTCFGGEYPFIQIGSLDASGNVVVNYKQTLNEKGFACSKMFEKGTLMIAIVGGTIGNLGILGKDMCFPDSIVGIRPRQESNQEYILLLLRYYQPIIRKLAYQMAGQPNIKLPTLNNLVCYLPPLAEQEFIVKHLELLFNKLDRIKSLNAENQETINKLNQIVLKEMFEG